MKSKFTFAKLIILLLVSGQVIAQPTATLELTGSSTVTGDGFGPRTTPHVVTHRIDLANNSVFLPYNPTVTATFSFTNQTYTGLTYGAGTTNPTGTSNAITTGLVFGAGPTLPFGGTVQQCTPFNSYDLLGAYAFGSGGPTNSMFTSNTLIPTAGTLNADATAPSPANDVNNGVEVFTTAQVLFDQNQPHSTTTRYLYGNLVITFNYPIKDPVVHLAGLGGSYRYLPLGANDVPGQYRSTYFSTELEYVNPGGITLSKLSGNTFLTVSGNNITNSATRPNGGSVNVPGDLFDNFGAATGSVKVTGTVSQLVFRVFLRGSNQSDFAWSSLGSVVTNGTRNPLSGDVWYVSTSFAQPSNSTLPVSGVNLTAALNGNDVDLKWKTTSEINSKHFEIERSIDGINFELLAVKQAAGNSVSELQYTHKDASMNARAYYYRLRLVDVDGKFTYSNTAVVRKAGGIKGIKTFPNPVFVSTNVEFSNAKGNYVISLFNQAGQEVKAMRATITNDVQYVTINRDGLVSGSYYIRVTNIATGEVSTEKLMLQ
jgi:hypothetical protein